MEVIPRLGPVFVEAIPRERVSKPKEKERAFIPAPHVTFNEPEVKSIAKRFINTYFPEVDCQ